MVSVQLKSCYGNNSLGRGGCSELASESVKCDTFVWKFFMELHFRPTNFSMLIYMQ